jgi:hypothetical protein
MVNAFSTTNGTNGPYYYFSIAIDADYSGILGDSGTVAGSMPDFTNWKNGASPSYLAGGITQGTAVWTCCDTNGTNLANWGNSTAPSLWVHTY